MNTDFVPQRQFSEIRFRELNAFVLSLTPKRTEGYRKLRKAHRFWNHGLRFNSEVAALGRAHSVRTPPGATRNHHCSAQGRITGGGAGSVHRHVG